LAYNCPVGANDVKKKLQDEINLLEYELRNELPREILKARLHGDLSENAEYHAAKDRQGFVNARLNQLKHRLAEMSMVDFTKIPHGKVGLGSTVVVMDTTKDEEITYFLVTTEEADAGSGKISTSSPIGRALLGKEVGDAVRVQLPGGFRELEILKLTTIHEATD
jgi:transcription elongation factor GreA